MKNPVRNLLRRLHSGPALFLLFAVGLVGAASIWADVGTPSVPVALVILYALLLSAAQSDHDVILSSVTKDSPYFLGFAFTLVVLVLVFRELGAADGSALLANEEGRGLLFRGVATALLTTIFGLAGRQALYATDPREEGADRVLQELTEGLRENSRELGATQAKLRGIISEFAELRMATLAEEEKVAKAYVRSLRKTTEKFSGLAGGLAGALERDIGQIGEATKTTAEASTKAMEALRSSQERLVEVTQSHETAIERLWEAVTNQLTEGLGRVDKALSEGAGKISAQFDAAGARISSGSRSLLEPIRGLGDDVEAVRSKLQQATEALAALPPGIDEAFKGQLAALTDSLGKADELLSEGAGKMSAQFDAAGARISSGSRSLLEPIRGLGDDVEAVRSKLQQATEALAALPPRLKQAGDDLANASVDQNEALTRRISSIMGDLEAIDSLVDQVVRVLKSRLPGPQSSNVR